MEILNREMILDFLDETTSKTKSEARTPIELGIRMGRLEVLKELLELVRHTI